MGSLPRPASLLAERAVRTLRESSEPLDSRALLFKLLSTRVRDEKKARELMQAAFADDGRLRYVAGVWILAPDARPAGVRPIEDPDRVLIFLEGGRPGGRPFQLHNVSVVRLRGAEVVGACGGDTPDGPAGGELRMAVLEVLNGATIVVHDPPGALKAFERWLGEPLDAPISLRRLAQTRIGLPASHTLESLAARLGLSWCDSEDPLDQADALDACLEALRHPGETLEHLREVASRGSAKPIDWSRYAFDQRFLRALPRAPGTYRFFDREDALLYVGKSKNLHHRIASYFRQGLTRSARVQELLDRLYRIEYEASGSELEAILREAEQIRREKPEQNVQRQTHEGRGKRLRSILILEAAEPPHVLRAFLIHESRLIARVAIGPRGGGLKRIQRALDDYFFFAPEGPTLPTGPDLDVELIVRWLAASRDRAVAFDPTSLRSSQEVVDRLRWFLGQGSPFDDDGSPVLPR